MLLSLAIVLAGDSPYVQMLLIVATMLIYMMVQLITWPWKLPALNAFDATISMSLILMMAILGAFAPDLTEQTLSHLTGTVIGIVILLNGVVLVMLCITASALIRGPVCESRSQFQDSGMSAVDVLALSPGTSLLRSAFVPGGGRRGCPTRDARPERHGWLR